MKKIKYVSFLRSLFGESFVNIIFAEKKQLKTDWWPKMPPKQRTGSVSKQCEECGGANPVACKICKN